MDEAGCFEFPDSAPIVIHKTYNLVSKLGMSLNLADEIDCAVVCAHDEDESSVSATTP